MMFELAKPEHESELRAMARQAEMPGWIALALAREPNFFHAAGIQGNPCQVLVALDAGRVVGVGCRSIRSSFVDGRERKTGYLSGLRLVPEVRGAGALARGFAALKRLHDESPVPFYTTTILDDSFAAARVLTSGRAGLPRYLDQGRYVSYAISMRPQSRPPRKDVEVLRGDGVGLANVVRFLREEGARRQFFPVIEDRDIGTDLLRGLRVEDFRVAVVEQSRIAGALAVWDQGAFKQRIVQGYAAPVAAFRPVINGFLRLAGFHTLPAPGQSLKVLFVALVCVANDDHVILRALLDRAIADNSHSGMHFLVIGFHERDPLRAVMRHFRTFRYGSRLHLVCWEDGLEAAQDLDASRIPYLEPATL